MMIFFPVRKNRRRSPTPVGVADGGRHLGELLDRVLDLFVQHPAVGHHDHGVEQGRAAAGTAVSSPISWCASQAMELLLPLPAECWIRYRLPTPLVFASASSFRTTSSWW